MARDEFDNLRLGSISAASNIRLLPLTSVFALARAARERGRQFCRHLAAREPDARLSKNVRLDRLSLAIVRPRNMAHPVSCMEVQAHESIGLRGSPQAQER